MKARVLKTIRSQINSLRNTLLPRQSGAVEGEAYSNAGESFQRSAGSIVQVTEEGRVIEAPDVKIVEGIATEVSNQRTAELEAILAEGLGAEYLSGSASGTMETSNVSFALTPTISKATGFFLSDESIICEKSGRYVFSVRCSLDGTVTGSEQARCTFGLQKNGVTHQQVSSDPILTTVRYLYKDCGTIVAVLDLSEGDAITFDATVIATTAFARANVSAWCVSARKASAGGASVITTKGDLIYGDASGEAERLPVGADGKVLKVVSGLPSWEDSSSLDPDCVFYVTTPEEFTAALEAEVPAGTKKVVWVLNSITITSNVSEGTTYQAALTSDVSIYGDHIDWTASGFLNSGASLYTVRFFNQYVVFNGYNVLDATKVRLLFKRVLFTIQQDYPTTFADSAIATYEADYRTLVFADTGGAPAAAYDPPTNWTNRMWDNTASAGTAPAQESFPMSIANHVATPAELTGQLWCSRFMSSASCTYQELGFFPIRGSLGFIVLGIYDATTDALLAQTNAFTPIGTKKIWWQPTTQSFTLEAGHEYYFALAASGDQLNVEALAWRQDPIIDSGAVLNKYLGPNISTLPDPKGAMYGHPVQCWMACK